MHTDRSSRWQTAFWIAWAALFVARLMLAATLAPFGDEAWYWQESRHLDIGYSDLPPATAWLIRCGETVFGHGVLAMRAPFLLFAALIPLIMMRLGRRLFDDAAGWCAGLLTLGLPLLGTLGIFALPDVPLTLAAALALDHFERAARAQRVRDWMVLGFVLAAAWLVHYRAAVLLSAGFAFFVLTPRGRTLARTPGLWLAVAISALGLIPTLAFNAQHAWVGVRFQFIDRHPWEFHADALVQPLEQAIVCTPLLYALLLWALWQVFKRARHGAPWDLLAVCSVVPIAAYFVLGCFADGTRFRLHWPLPGYLPLLLGLPVLLREFRLRAFAVPAFALLGLGDAIAFVYLGTAALPDGAAILGGAKAFPEHFVGWSEAAAKTRALLAQPQLADRVLVADNFMLGAELDFAFNGERVVYALDQPINAKHGRASQLALWQRDEAGLDALGMRTVLLVAEPTARRERERAAWTNSLCTRVADLSERAQLDLFGGRKRYRWYVGAIPPTNSVNADCAANLRTR